MTKKELTYILKKRKWPLSSVNNIYAKPPRFILVFVAVMLLVIDILILDLIIRKEYNDIANSSLQSYLIIAGGLVSGLVLIRFVIKNLTFQRAFTEIEILKHYDTKEILDIVHDLGWKGNTDNVKNTVEVITSGSFFFGGERVTIVILDDRLLFNSRHIHKARLIDRNDGNFKKFREKITDAN